MWEAAAMSIRKREEHIDKIRVFEKRASNPRRLFRGSSKQRLVEERKRKRLEERLRLLTTECSTMCKTLFDAFGDVITLDERDYQLKMKADMSELLFDVERERLMEADRARMVAKLISRDNMDQ